MIKKMCPICDMPLSEGNYCPRCRKLVRHPYLQNVDYYLNETHPASETDCEFHHPYLEADHHGEAQSPKGALSDGNAGKGKPERPRASLRRVSTRRKAAVNLSGFVVMLFVMVLMTAWNAYTNRRSNQTAMTEEYQEDYGFEDFSEEEVKAAGLPCSGVIHFPVDGKAVKEILWDYVKNDKFGYAVESEDVYSDNYSIDADTGEKITYYDTIETIYLQDPSRQEEGNIYEYMDMEYDTGNGELHEYSSFLTDKDISLELLEYFLASVEEGCTAPQGESKRESLMEQARRTVLDSQNGYLIDGLFEITIYSEEGGVQIYVGCTGPETMKGSEV